MAAAPAKMSGAIPKINVGQVDSKFIVPIGRNKIVNRARDGFVELITKIGIHVSANPDVAKYRCLQRVHGGSVYPLGLYTKWLA